MNTKALERLPTMAAVVLLVLVLAACAIRLRGDENQPLSTTSVGQASDPLATKLAECRSITYGQKDELAECRKAWAERRHQFLGQKAPASSDTGTSPGGASLFVVPKNENRLSPGSFPTPQSEKE